MKCRHIKKSIPPEAQVSGVKKNEEMEAVIYFNLKQPEIILNLVVKYKAKRTL